MKIRKSSKKIGQLIVEAGLVSALDIDHALQSQQVFGGLLGTNLVEMGLLDSETLAAFLSEQYGVPMASIKEFEAVSPQALLAIPPAAAGRLSILPLQISQTELCLAMVDPSEQRIIQRIEGNVKKSIVPRVASELVIRFYLERHYKIARSSRYIQLSENIFSKNKKLSSPSQDDLENRNLDEHISVLLPADKAIHFYFQHIKSLHKVPVVQNIKNIKDYDLSPNLIFLLAQIDGIQSLQEIISVSIFSKITTLKALIYLAQLRIISFEDL
ncbi:MAG: hypothetical protein R3A11_02585 [Bdellovibrionota bacterium]